MLKNTIFLLLFLTASPAFAQDMFQEYLYSADIVMKNRDKISLSDAQADRIKKIHSNNAADFSTIKWDLDAATETLKRLLAETKPDQTTISKQMDVVLGLENSLKKKQLSTLVAIKNELTGSQQAFLKNSKNWTLYGTGEKISPSYQSISPQFRVGSPSIVLDRVFVPNEPVKGVTSTISPSGDMVITSDSKSTIYFQVDPKKVDDKPLYYLQIKNGFQEIVSFDDINPKDINKVEVLKGESATARFGEKGKNGVIIITLKQTPDELPLKF